MKHFSVTKPIAVLALLVVSYLQPSPLQHEPYSASTVITAHGKNGTVVELAAADLAIKVDGKDTAVKDVHRLSRPPLHYCLVFDTSKSELPVFQQQQEAARDLLAKVIHTEGDRGWFLPFSDDPRPGPETNRPSEIAEAIAKEQPKGATALYDAMVGCSERMQKSNPYPGLRAMFIFSDGNDDESRVDLDMTVQALLQAEIKSLRGRATIRQA